MGNDSVSLGRGAGLRQHHANAGVSACANCHSDASPANYTPVGEDVLPNYYANPGSNHPLIPEDPCNPNGSEGVFAGTLLGLDNDGNGIYDTADDACSVNQPPVADASGPYSGTAGTPVNFDGSASADPDGSIVSYAWDFGDGNSGAGVSPAHTYAADGNYTVSLTVTDNDGASDTASSSVTIQTDAPPPGMVTIEQAKWKSGDKRSKLEVTGIYTADSFKTGKPSEKSKRFKASNRQAQGKGLVVIISNADTGKMIGSTRIRRDGSWKFDRPVGIAPCRVRATVNDQFDEENVLDAPANCQNESGQPTSTVPAKEAGRESGSADSEPEIRSIRANPHTRDKR